MCFISYFVFHTPCRQWSAILESMSSRKSSQPKRQTVALEALRQGMAIIRKGNDVYTLHQDGSTELLSSSRSKHRVWHDALGALETGSQNTDDRSQTDTEKTLIIYTDGGSRGNPGPSASGYVILNHDESRVLERGGEYLGIMTNNQAEYHAVTHGLEAARKFQPQHLSFCIDSLLVVNQLNGVYKVKNKELRPMYETIQDLSGGFGSVEFTHVNREHNRMADEEVNKILDGQEGA